jgi:ABC-2 type transport system permease protein
MTFLSGALTIASKELRHLLHDPHTLVLTLGLPVFTLLLFGYALDTRVRNVPTAIEDLDQGTYSRALITDFAQSPVFRVVKANGTLEDRLRTGEIKVGVRIPSGYSAAMFYGRPTAVHIWVDGSDAVLSGQTAAAAKAIGAQHAVRIALDGTQLKEAPAHYEAQTLFNPEGRSANYFVPALTALLAETTTLLLVALSMAKEYERGTLDQLRITAIPLSALVAGKLLTCGSVGLAVSALMLVLLKCVFGVAVAGNTWLLCFALLAFQGPALGIGLILTAEARSQAQAQQLAYFVFLPSILLSGLVFPRETMPAPAQFLSGLLPTTWSMQVMRGIVLRGATGWELAQPFFFLLALTLTFLALGTWRLAKRVA